MGSRGCLVILNSSSFVRQAPPAQSGETELGRAGAKAHRSRLNLKVQRGNCCDTSTFPSSL